MELQQQQKLLHLCYFLQRVIATAFLSVCLSVRLSVTFRCFVQRNEDTIMQFSLSVAQSFYFRRGKVHLEIRRVHPQQGR